MEMISLKGSDVHYTEDSSASYLVSEGTVLVYLIPQIDGVDGRRLLLGEFEAGSRIPAMSHHSDLFGDWRFGLVALEQAVIVRETGSIDESAQMDFAKAIGLRISGTDEFETALIEKYEMLSVKEKAALYGTKREQTRTRERILELIANQFTNDAVGEETVVNTGRPLYDAAAFLCKKEKINIASLDRIQETSGRRFNLSDIARVSHFVIREIVLEPGWHKRDNGPILAYRKEDNAPVACFPKGPRKYLIYDPKTEKTEVLTDATAESLKNTACMFYRPFPEKELGKKDLFFFGMQKVYKSDILRLFILTLVGTLIGLLIPYLNEQAYDKFIPIGNSSGLLQIGAVMLACALGNISFTIVRNLAVFRSMNSMEYAAQAATFDRLFNLPESFFRKYDAAALGQRAMGVAAIYNMLAQSVITSLLSAAFSLLYLWRMFHYSIKMSAWSIVLLGAIVAVITLIGHLQIKYSRQKREIDLETQSRSYQYLSGIAKIRNASAEDRALYRYMEKFTESIKLNSRIDLMTLRANTLATVSSLLFSLVFFYLMIRQNIGLSIGAFAAFTAAFGSFSGAVLTIVQNYLTVSQIKPIYEDVQPILETLPENSEDADLPGEIRGDIEISNVTFAYEPDRPPVIQNMNLHIKEGEYVGIVGSSGCGKSTLLKLLLGFEKPQIGRIYYDNRDIDEIDKRELRKKFGVVLQDGGLFAGSILENIRIASPGIKLSRVEEVIREVGLADDIKRMPMGLHTMVSEGAGTISGGQRQRLLIARAIVAKPRVIFLDEATSALDNVTQSQIVQTLEQLDATKIVIAHRLSTIKNCDRIIVMDRGQIVEQGTYEELMALNGLFYSLAIRQIS